MPYKYIEPEIAYFNKELEIYRTYDYGDYDIPFEYWFTLDKDTADKEGYYEFDIREFEAYDKLLTIEENFEILTDEKYITKDGWKYEKYGKVTKHML